MDAKNDLIFTLQCRTLVAAGVALILHVVSLAAYSAIISTDLFHPFSLVYNFTSTIFSPRKWLFWIPSGVLMAIVCLTTLYDILRQPSPAKCRLDLFTRNFSSRKALLLLSYALIAFFIPILASGPFTQPCEENAKLRCLNVSSGFVASCATFCGLATVFGLNFHEAVLPALINLHAHDYIRPTFFKTAKNSVKKSFRLTLCFIPVFYIGRKVIINAYAVLFAAYLEKTPGIFNPWVLLSSWLLGAVTICAILMLKEILDLYLSQYLELPVSSLVSLLEKRLSPFEEELVFKDLAQLAVGRSVVPVGGAFALSQPGGLPHNWNTILKNTLRVIDAFKNELNECHGLCQPKKSAPEQFEAKNPQTAFSGLRRLRTSQGSPPPPRQEDFLDFISPLTNQWTNILNKANFLTFRPLYYFTEPQQELYECSLLENSNKVLLAASALSGLSCRALKDDIFGVMVNDLPQIINTLFSLEETMDKVVLPKKRMKSNLARSMHQAIILMLKRCLSQIAITYSAHIEFLPLTPNKIAALKRIAQTGQEKELNNAK